MNIIFMGTPEFAVTSLHSLLNSNHKISAVVTVPDKPKGRGLGIAPSSVKEFALSNNLKILQPEKLRDENFINEVKDLNPDLIVVVAFRILPKEIYSISKYGSFNLHSSLLPKYRGAAPINWAIINGEKQTGVTTFFLQDKVDTGSIILQLKYEISDSDDAGTVHAALASLGAEAVIRTADLIEFNNGKVPAFAQNDSESSSAPKIFKEDCRINWNSSAGNVFNFIRGLSPYPTAFTTLNGKILKIFKTGIVPEDTIKEEPGTLSTGKNNMFVSCGDGKLEILELQSEGKRKMLIADFLNGFKITGGEKFV